MMDELTESEYKRYDRQIALPQFGIESQERLKQSRVLLMGVGGLGCAAALYLARSGIGALTLVDFDVISESNLPRQILYQASEIGQLKAQTAQCYLKTLCPDLEVHALSQRFDDARLFKLIQQHDLVLDCTDNLQTREQINRGCFLHQTPLVSGAAIRMEGWITSFDYQKNSPCYHCLSPFFQWSDSKQSCSETGVLTPLTGMIGTLQVAEAIKMLTQIGTLSVGKLQLFDLMHGENRAFFFKKQAHCAVCGLHDD